MTEEIQEEEIQQGPGAMLKERRESLQLSIEDIANKLHLRPVVITELENDIIDHAVSMTFTKGYFRLYAKHLEIDPAPVLEAFEKLANPIRQPAKLQSFSQKMAKQASDTRLMMFSYFILFVVIAMAVIWWFQLPGASNETANISNDVATTETNIATSRSVGTERVPVNVSSDPKPTPPDSDFAAGTLSTASKTSSLQPSESENIESTDVESIDGQSSSTEPELNSLADDLQDQAVEGLTEQSESRFTSEDDSVSVRQSGSTTGSNVAQASIEDATSEGLLLESGNFGDNARQESNLENINSQVGDFQEPSADVIEASFSSIGGEQGQLDDSNAVNPITQEIVFTFIEDCWMNLTDATGENIAYGVKNAGRVMPVNGIPPFEVVLGAPQGVQISVDGVLFDMSQFPAGRTARFTIGE